MSKRWIIVISIILIVLLGITSYFMFNSNNKVDSNNQTNSNNEINSTEIMNPDEIDKEQDSQFELDNNNKYIITTDSQFTTLMNDGGSHYDIYYQIDLEQKLIRKCADNYIGFKGYEYQGKVIYEKNISDELNNEIKNLLDELLSKIDDNDDNNYHFYTIESYDSELKMIYNEASINKIKDFLNKVDNL